MNKILALAILAGGAIAVVGLITFWVSGWLLNRKARGNLAKIRKYNTIKTAGVVMMIVGVFIIGAAISWVLDITFWREVFK